MYDIYLLLLSFSGEPWIFNFSLKKAQLCLSQLIFTIHMQRVILTWDQWNEKIEVEKGMRDICVSYVSKDV